jgi:hypothetical protein
VKTGMRQYAPYPILTERDSVESAEGGLDPLGTEALADSLAVRLAPGVRERQRHPRFLTAMAVSVHVCSDFDEDRLAADGISEPWQVFEWYMVEGLVRKVRSEDRIGLPGSQKADKALHDRVPLSAKQYLKAPSVFGFHGVYRLLCRTLGIEDDGRLGETGYDLLNVWAEEQGLGGFVGTGGGPGRSVYGQMKEAVEAGLEKGATARTGTWAGWGVFADHLGLYGAGPNEAQFLWKSLLNDQKGFRREIMETLVSPAGAETWRTTRSERQFHRHVRAAAKNELRQLLDAIDAYETFSRLCQDAFQDCLYEMTRQGGKKTPLDQLAVLPSVQVAASTVPDRSPEVLEKLEPVGEAGRFRDIFSDLAERGSAAEWADRLIEHHRKIQRQKPPNGKNPWFERFDDGSLIIRPDYRTDRTGTHDDSYVHLYRTESLWQFARDLREVQA